MRAAIYARLSRAAADDRQGVEYQLKLGREHAERLGWDISGEFSDNDRTAYKNRLREGFEALCEGMRAGDIDAVVFQHQDRLARNTRTWDRFLALTDEFDIRLEAWAGAPADTKTATGRYQTKIQAATDEHYSALISEKSRAGHARIAAEGIPNGGGQGGRPFGYLKGGMELHPTEAPIMRDLFEKFLAGVPIRALARWLNEQNVTTTTGRQWRAVRVRDILRNPRYAGRRIHRGEDIGEAAWTPIIDRGTFEAVDGILRSRRREGYDGRRTYLLTGGIAVCGLCGTNLVAAPHHGRRAYKCPPKTNPTPGCGGVAVLAEPFEALVAAAVIHLVDASDVLTRLRVVPDEDEISRVRVELAGREQALEELAVDYYTERRLSRREFFAARDQLEQQIDALRIRLAEASADPDPMSLVNGVPVVESWQEWDLDRRRALISAVLQSVSVVKAVPGLNKFDPERVTLNWRA